MAVSGRGPAADWEPPAPAASFGQTSRWQVSARTKGHLCSEAAPPFSRRRRHETRLEVVWPPGPAHTSEQGLTPCACSHGASCSARVGGASQGLEAFLAAPPLPLSAPPPSVRERPRVRVFVLRAARVRGKCGMQPQVDASGRSAPAGPFLGPRPRAEDTCPKDGAGVQAPAALGEAGE